MHGDVIVVDSAMEGFGVYKLRGLVVAAVLGLSLVGCGPIVGGVQILNADIALSAARTAGAEKDAKYEYVAAQEYLQKAREEHGYSDYWAARVYADKATALAKKAKQKALAAQQAEQPAASTTSSAPTQAP